MKKNLIPRSVLFGNPEKTKATISRDGRHISYLAPVNGVMNIHVAKTDNFEDAYVLTDETERGIIYFTWARDKKHIIYLQDTKGDENYQLYLCNIDTKEVKNLTPFEGVKTIVRKMSINHPEKIIVGLNKRIPEYFDLYELNIKNGQLKMFYENKEKFSEFHLDDNYQLLFAGRENAEGGAEIYKFNKDLSFDKFLNIKAEDIYTTYIVDINTKKDVMYMVSSIDRDTSALISWNLKNNKKTTLYQNEKVDVRSILKNPISKDIQAVLHYYKKGEWEIFDQDIKEDFKILKSQSHPEGEIHIFSRTDDDRKWTVKHISDDNSACYSVYDRDKKENKVLFSSNSSIDKYDLAKRHPITIQTRDGLDMVCYLTLPAEVTQKDKSYIPSKPVPMVLEVHGGPTARDTWGFCPSSQWLSNRGYAVLQVNYRGSSGFGKKFINLGNGEWANKMHDDLIDAVNWAVENKVAIKDKVAIMGGSYGGYAALVGLTFTPDVFACGIDVVGPSNLVTLLNSIPPYWKPAYNALVNKLGGNPNTEEGKQFLASRSPLTFCNRIKKPLLIAQGANDPRVKQAESDQIVKELKKNKIPVTYLLYPDEGHGFVRPQNRRAFYAVAEQYLAKCLGGDTQPIDTTDIKNSSVQIIENANIKGLEIAV